VSDLILGEDAPDVEDFLARWLAPVMRTAAERETDDELPFCQLARISGADDPNEGIDDPVVQLDVFDTARNGMLAVQSAKISARNIHRRMTLLARELSTVTLSDGSLANADSVTTVLKPFRMPYANERVVRYVARYQVDLSYVTV